MAVDVFGLHLTSWMHLACFFMGDKRETNTMFKRLEGFKVVYNKYKNQKVVVDGITFDSIKEAKRYRELKFMEKCGLIKGLELQKIYELQPKFRKNNKTYQKISYMADFTYYDIEREQIMVEDIKGYKTDVYKLKKKLFEYKYPELELREI